MSGAATRVGVDPTGPDRLPRLYAALGAVSEAAAGPAAEADLFEAVCDALHGVAGFDQVSIRVTDGARATLEPVAFRGWTADSLSRYELAPSTPEDSERRALGSPAPLSEPTARAFLEARTIRIDDYLADQSLSASWERARRQRIGSLMAAPLVRDEQVVGTLTVGSVHTGFFDDANAALVERIAKLLATALARRHAMARLAASEEHYRRLNAIASDWIWECDARLRMSYLSDSFYEITGSKPDALIGQSIDQLDHAREPGDRQAFLQALAGREPFRNHEYVRNDPDGKQRWRSLSGDPVFGPDGSFVGYQGTCRDITERKLYEAELVRQASVDPLTGLPNRSMLIDRMERALARAGRRQRTVAVMLLDLDRFKLINDGFGHDAGDAVLVTTAARMVDCVRGNDTIARLGGDEFVALVESVDKEEDVPQVAQRLLDTLAQPLPFGADELQIGASVGIALYPRDGTTADELLRNADIAMYQVKGSGRNGYHFYTEALNRRAARRLELQLALRRALDRGEFELHYQPIVSCAGERLVGAEALIRWRAADGRLRAPIEFLDVAEDSGLIVPIGAWVLGQACAQAQRWSRAGWPVPVAVNVSALQFRQDGLVDEVRSALGGAGLAPALLTLEITESTMMADLDRTAAALSELAAMGVATSIDDFGTGYSSLSYLKRFPVRCLKIDRSFVAELHHDADDAAIVRAVIDLAHALGRQVVAEGVEVDAQAELLRGYGCDAMQGYRQGRPMAATDFDALLRGQAGG